MTIKVMSYEECREDFFVKLIKHAENKIKYWKRQKGYCCEIQENLENAGAEISYCQDALNALEKQIPKKVNISLKGTTDWNTKCHCPNCRALISNGKYCYECGQALDWSEEE